MKTLVLVAHPEVKDSGTQQFLKEAVKSTQNVSRRELVLDQTGTFHANQEMQDVLACDRIIFQFPLYWYSAPALLHQWLADCLVTPYREKLRGKELGLVVTTGRPAAEFAAGKAQHFSLSEILRPFSALALNLGLKELPAFIVAQFAYQTEEQHQQLLIDYCQYLELPADFSFRQQEEWSVERLKKLSRLENDPAAQQLLLQLADLIDERSERLAELKEEIQMIKDVEEGDQ
ncbi:NADPH-quinone reductase [Ligilactobacillus salitolerans]|uniref:NADPH-quinone reductase n=1 Tax=Ligilactobacillus salitolerans TaxID=1808352 RepID=A0A401IUB4_9LACO|nr:NAD(P)H-dependent oxidoreductase [Ligilactobacillus salitolerans]GBG95114.1 NADPH-quinone reductase [Ligilactobacillus salitolerans]